MLEQIGGEEFNGIARTFLDEFRHAIEQNGNDRLIEIGANGQIGGVALFDVHELLLALLVLGNHLLQVPGLLLILSGHLRRSWLLLLLTLLHLGLDLGLLLVLDHLLLGRLLLGGLLGLHLLLSLHLLQLLHLLLRHVRIRLPLLSVGWLLGIVAALHGHVMV